MSFVTEQIFAETYRSIEGRLGQMETRLNDLFTKVDERFKEQSSAMGEVGGKIPLIMEQIKSLMQDGAAKTAAMEQMKLEMPTTLQTLLGESKSYVTERTETIGKLATQLQEAFQRLQGTTVQIRADMSAMGNSGSGGSGGHRSKSLIDSKNFVIAKFDGDKAVKEDWDEWRDDLEDYLETFFPKIKTVLTKAARWAAVITAENFDEICRAAGGSELDLAWTYMAANDEIFRYVKKQLTGRARKAFITTEQGGFDGFRRTVAEIDPINKRTKGAMMSRITGMVTKGSSKNTRELKSRLLDLEVMVKKYRERVNEVPDDALLASILSNLLDEKTRDTFTNEALLDNYAAMKLRILATATEADFLSNKMDVGNVDIDDKFPRDVPVYPISTPDKSVKFDVSPTNSSKTGSEGVDLDIQAAELAKRAPNPNIRCWTCNGIGHPSFLCPQKPKGESKGSQLAKGAPKGYFKGNWSKGKQGSKGSWGGKSGGYGKGGKGAMALDDWGDYGWEWNLEPSAFTGALMEVEPDSVECDDNLEPRLYHGPVEEAVYGYDDYDRDQGIDKMMETEEVREGKTYAEWVATYREVHPDLKEMFAEFKEKIRKEKMQKVENEKAIDRTDDDELHFQSDDEEDCSPTVQEPTHVRTYAQAVTGGSFAALQEVGHDSDEEDMHGEPLGEVVRMETYTYPHSNGPSSSSRPEVIDPVTGETHCCFGHTCEQCIEDNDDGPPLPPPAKAPVPTARRVRRGRESLRLAEAYSETQPQCPCWDCGVPQECGAPQASVIEEPWNVAVNKSKEKKKNSNQRRAAARKPKSENSRVFTGVLEEEGPTPICTAGEWEKIELTVDSGAAETICPTSCAPGVKTTAGIKMTQGVRYTCAGGRKIPNLGEKKCVMMTTESNAERRLTIQVADVNRALLSVSKAVDGGNRVVFDHDWSYIEDRNTGERTTLVRKGGLYVIETWVKTRQDDAPPSQPFGRQGPQP